MGHPWKLGRGITILVSVYHFPLIIIIFIRVRKLSHSQKINNIVRITFASSKEDLYWLELWYQAVVTMKHQDVYPPNETMLVMSLKQSMALIKSQINARHDSN